MNKNQGNPGDINLDIPYTEHLSTWDMGSYAMAGVLTVKEDCNNLLKRIESIEKWILNYSVPMYKPPGSEKHLPLGEVLSDIYNRIETCNYDSR